MKKIVSIFVSALAGIFVSVSAFAQEPETPVEAPVEDYYVADEPVVETAKPAKKKGYHHLAISGFVGNEGVGATVSFPLTKHIHLRAGYSKSDLLLNYGGQFAKMELNPYTYTATNLGINQNGIKIDEIDLTVDAGKQVNASALLDVYVLGGIRITGGVYYNLGDPNLISVVGTPYTVNETTGERTNAVPPADRANTRIYGITTDPEGNLHLNVGSPDGARIKPYLGVGLGKQCTNYKRLGFTLDAGFLIGMPMYSYDYSKTEDGNPSVVLINNEWIQQLDVDEIKNAIAPYQMYINYWSNFQLYPVVRVSLFLRLF